MDDFFNMLLESPRLERLLGGLHSAMSMHDGVPDSLLEVQTASAMNVLRGRNFLMTPGPTNIPERVLRAMQRPAIELGTREFIELCRSCIDDLKPIFKTQSEVFVYPANGHGAWEAAVANVLAPGDTVLVPETGVFSQVWSRVAAAFGASVQTLPGDWRTAIDPATLATYLRRDTRHRIKALLVVQTDTATGLTSDVSAIRTVLDDINHPALLLVDAVASLAAIDFRMDEWRVDVAVAASQKALMSPPGLSFTAVSPKALAVAEREGSPRYYWDWRKRRSEEWYDWFCGTAPEHLLFALREAIDMVREEGLEAIFERHAGIARAVRAAVEVWSTAGAVELNARHEHEASNSVSTIRVDEAFDATAINDMCRERFNVSLGSGLGRLDGRAFRIGHMGDINEAMVLGALASVEATFSLCRIPHGKGGVGAAIESLLQAPSAEGPRRVHAAR